jgi:DNA segregation ATPase FtsK/SpoIIIE, S-DNA-T family
MIWKNEKTKESKNTNSKESVDRFCNLVAEGSKIGWAITKEIAVAAYTRTLPLTECLLYTIAFCLLRLTRLDESIFYAWGYKPPFLRWDFLFWVYNLTGIFSGFIIFGIKRSRRTVKITKKLKEVCDGIGLKSAIGETPGFVSDFPIDDANRILRLDRKFIPLEEFVKKQGSIAGAMQVHIDEIEEIREDGTISILYSPVPLPSLFLMPDIMRYKDFTFPIGKARSKEIVGDFKKNPHMLIAGESGGGKSAFQRQLIATAYLNNENAEFLLIDLKGNLEFQFFQGLPRVRVCSEVKDAVDELKLLKDDIQTRFGEIKSIGAKDFEDYERIRIQKVKSNVEHMVVPNKLSRVFIILDEAWELSYVTQKTRSGDIRTATEVLSQIARQGRALGFHLVFSTQRPDAAAINSQIKSNLESIISYKIANHASSMTILDNGRAAQLPKIPGRAIWKMGGQMTEVQTPFLDIPELERIINPLKTQVASKQETNKVEAKDEKKAVPKEAEAASPR